MANYRVITSEDPSGKSTVQELSPIEPDNTSPISTVWNIWKVEPHSTLPVPGPVPAPFPDVAGIAPGEVQVFRFTIPAKTDVTSGGPSIEFHGERPGFHSTDTIDVQTCVEGEMTLLLDDQDVTLKTGDTAILHGQAHGWANRGDVPATMFVTIVGAPRGSGDGGAA